MRKKFEISITVLIIVAYLASNAFLFSSVKTYLNAEFIQFYNNLFYSLNSEYAAETPESLITNTVGNLPKNTAFYIAVIGDNNEIVAESGSYIRFDDLEHKDQTIFLEKYLTDDLKKEIKSFLDETNNSCDVTQLKYKVVNSENVPVAFTLTKRSECGTFKEFIISNDEDYITVDFTYSTRYSWCDFYDLDNDSKLHKNIQRIKNNDGSYSESSFDFLSYSDISYIELADGLYTLYVSMATNPVTETLKSHQFIVLVLEETLVFALIYVALIIIIKRQKKESSRLEEARYMFACAAAHELKTPLSVIENQCECVIENIAPEKNAEYISSVYSEAIRMNRLVQSLLQYSKIASVSKIKKEPYNISEIIHNEAEKYISLINENEIELRINDNVKSNIKCNAELIALVIDNFISNAVKHTACKGKIIITAGESKNQIKVSVFNEGKQIEAENENSLWDAFYKEDKSRTRKDNSTGMGLAVSKVILEHHKFKYGYENKENGVEFYFTAKK